MRIPKTLIQTARSYEALPAEIKQNIDHLKSRNPDWEYRFFDDDQMKSYLRSNLQPEEWALLQEINPRYGVVLADNYSAYTLEINRSQLAGPLDEVIDQLAEVVDVQPRDRRRFRRLMEDSKSFESLPIRTKLTDEEVARFAEGFGQYAAADALSDALPPSDAAPAATPPVETPSSSI